MPSIPACAAALLAVAAFGCPAPAAVQQGSRMSTLVVYGNDPCPRSSDSEIVVCARQPESERYRIPKQFRGRRYDAARDGSWAGTAMMLEQVSREGIVNSCSPVGTGGQTGCFQKFLAESRR